MLYVCLGKIVTLISFYISRYFCSFSKSLFCIFLLIPECKSLPQKETFRLALLLTLTTKLHNFYYFGDWHVWLCCHICPFPQMCKSVSNCGYTHTHFNAHSQASFCTYNPYSSNCTCTYTPVDIISRAQLRLRACPVPTA